MMQESAIQPNSNVIPMPSTQQRSMFDMPGCSFTTIGLIIEPGLPIDDWVELGKRLVAAKDSLGIWRGDWVEYGKHEYGKKYEEALALTGLKYGTLANDVWVAKAVPISLRSEKLTPKHYKKIAPLKSKSKIRKWIERAIKGDGNRRWSASRLEKEITKATEPPATSDNKNYLDPYYKQFLLDYIASQNSFLNRCTYEPFKREIEATIRRARFQLGRTETSDFEAVKNEVDQGATTIEEIAEAVYLPDAEIDRFCVKAVGCPRPRGEDDPHCADTEYEWRPIGVKIEGGHGMRPRGIFRKDAPHYEKRAETRSNYRPTVDWE